MKKIWLLGVISVLAFSACSTDEPVRETAYFEGLGFEKTLEYIISCREEKRSLLASKDAEGLDRFAKSSKAKNCLTGLKYAQQEEAKIILSKAKILNSASSVQDLKREEKAIADDHHARWGDTFTVFPDWKKSAPAIAGAFYEVGATSSRRHSRIMIGGMGK